MNAAHMEFCSGPLWKQMVTEMVMPAVLAGRDLGDDVIEIGPGPGFTTDVLRTRVGHVTAVELDAGLAEKLAGRLAGTNVDVVNRDATSLELPDDRFSGALCCNMLHHVPTAELQDLIFAELARVVVAGGRIAAADSAPRDQLDEFHEGDVYNPIDAADLAARLERVGFVDVEIRDYDLGWVCSAVVGPTSA